jgi:hypothetical protein
VQGTLPALQTSRDKKKKEEQEQRGNGTDESDEVK